MKPSKYGHDRRHGYTQRGRNTGAPRPPLRTVKEIAETLGIHWMSLANALRAENAPQPMQRTPNGTYYVAAEVLRWWHQRPTPIAEAGRE